MKRVLVFAVLVAGLTGCSSVPQTQEGKSCGTMEPLLMLSYASMDQASQLNCLTAELKAVGMALQKYADDHGGRLPPRLSTLVSESYLTAGSLVSSADPTGGKEGGVPDSYSDWGQATEADESGSSYLYEFNAAPCKWDWKSYLGGKPGPSDVDTDRDGTVSWSEAKNWQMLHGDVTQQPKNKPYDKSRFPVVRCYWYQYPTAYTLPSGRTVLNLAADLQTVFLSQPWWEKDQ